MSNEETVVAEYTPRSDPYAETVSLAAYMPKDEESKEEVVEVKPVEVIEEVKTDVVKSGHISHEDWVKSGKNPNEWRSEREYKERGELINTIKSLQQEAWGTKKTLSEVQKYQEQLKTDAYNKAVSDLKQQQENATYLGNTAEVSSITDKLIDLHRSAPVPVEVTPVDPQAISPEVLKSAQDDTRVEAERFMQRNSSWFKPSSEDVNDQRIVNFAVAEQNRILTQKPELRLQPAVYLKLVEDAVKEMFPTRVEGNKASVVERSEPAPSVRTGVKNLSDLPAYHQQMFKAIKETDKSYKIEDYIANLKRFGEI